MECDKKLIYKKWFWKSRSLRCRISMLVMTALLVFFRIFPVLAAQPTGTLKLVCTVEREGKLLYLSGDTYGLERIADGEVTGSGKDARIRYQIRQTYQEFDGVWNYTTASAMQRQARKLEKVVLDAKKELPQAVTDTYGEALFGNLTPGFYLVMRLKADSKNNSYAVDPFLISVPQVSGKGAEYVVSVKPKIEWEDIRPSQPGENPSENPTKPSESGGDDPGNPTRPSTPGGDDPTRPSTPGDNDPSYPSEEDPDDPGDRDPDGEEESSAAPDEDWDPETDEDGDNGNTPQDPDDGNKPGDSSHPHNGSKPDNGGNSGNAAKPALPVTGQLWWPVWPMALTGLTLIGIGRYRKKH